MKKKLTILAVIMLTLFNLTALTTVAYQRWSSAEGFRGLTREEIGMCGFRDLGFDEGQMARMRESRRVFVQRTEPLEMEMHRLRLQMFELIRADEPDTSVVFAMVDSIGSIQNELQKEAISRMLDEGSILTLEQKKRLFGMFERHMDRKWKHRRGPGRGMRGGGGPPFLPPWDIAVMDGRMGIRECGDGWPGCIAKRRVNEITQGGN